MDSLLSPGASILQALQDRLSTIKKVNGYPLDVKKVEINKGSILFNLPASTCPLIEVVQTAESYQPQAGGMVDIQSGFALRLVNTKDTSDAEMEVFKSAVVRAIYANSYNRMSGVAGIGLADKNGKNTIIHPTLIDCETDLNMAPGNRIYAISFQFTSIRQLCQF